MSDTIDVSGVSVEVGYGQQKQAQVDSEMVEVGFYYPSPIFTDISKVSGAPVEVGYGLQKQVHLSDMVIEVGYLGASYGWQIGPRLQLEGG